MYNVCIMILKPTLNWPVDCVWNFKSLQLRVVPSIAIKFGQLLVLQILNVSRIVKVFFFLHCFGFGGFRYPSFHCNILFTPVKLYMYL